MEKLLRCIVLLAVASLVQCTLETSVTGSEELMENVKINMIKNYLKERQAMAAVRERTEKICPGYGDRFERALLKVQTCTNSIDEDNETMCSAVKNHFEKCFNPVVAIFEECLPQKSKDLPSFFVKSLLGVSEQLCKTDGEHIFELSNPCVRSQNYRTQRCIRKIQSKLQQYSSNIPEKQEVCEFLQSFRGCLQSHLHASCGHEKTREAFLNIYDAVSKPCQSELDSLNEIEIKYAVISRKGEEKSHRWPEKY